MRTLKMNLDYTQLTSVVIMVRPDYFDYDPETAATNEFMKTIEELGVKEEDVRPLACKEFDAMVETLQSHRVRVCALDSPKDTPDAVFPNNWFTLHSEPGGKGVLVLYPMQSENRRRERQIEELLECLSEFYPQGIRVVSLTKNEQNNLFLEGTGSLVLDRVHKVAFAVESARTNHALFERWCEIMGYKPVFFHAFSRTGSPVYHTNVVMSIGKRWSVVCLDAIHDAEERANVMRNLEECNKTIIEISLDQMHAYCGNVLELLPGPLHPDSRSITIMSATAYRAFNDSQREQLRNIVQVDIPVIEGIGGGSARCMMAELF